MNIPLFFYFCTCSREIIDIFSHFKDILTVVFLGHHWSKIFQILLYYNLACGLHFDSRFDDLDFVSRSQVCQKYKLQTVCLGPLSSVF